MEAVNIGLKRFKKGKKHSILTTVDRMGARLEQICRAGISLEQAFARARTHFHRVTRNGRH